jgi:hypothetical protein
MHLNKRNGYFVSQLEKAGEPIHTTMWRLFFDFAELRRYEENLGTNFNVFDSETLSLMIKEYTPPTVEMNTDDVYYMGAKKVLPTTNEYESTMNAIIQENNTLTGYKNIMRWMQYCVNDFSYSPEHIGEEKTLLSANRYDKVYGYGAPIYKNKDDQVFGNFFVNNNTIHADIYDHVTGEVVLRVSYINIYPTKISPPVLDYENPKLYQYRVEFKYSRYVYTVPTGSNIRINNNYTSQSGVQWGNSN